MTVAAKFFVEGVANYVLSRGIDKLIEFVNDKYPVSGPKLTANDKAVLGHFQASVPSSYQRVGVLFEVLTVQEESGDIQSILLPRSFGESPTGAVVNETIFNDKDLPALPEDVRNEWAERRARIAELVERGDAAVDRSGFWWELDRVSKEWSVRPSDLSHVEQQARRTIENGLSMAALSKAAPTIQALRANAAQWLTLRNQAESRIADLAIKSQIRSLADANERMVADIDKAVKDLKRAQEFQGFISTLGMLSSVLGASASLSPSENANNASSERMIALENYSRTAIIRAGEEMRRINLELNNIYRGYVTPDDILPGFKFEVIDELVRD